ncbi:MAG: hypothetical protein JMN27_18555 [gamma proteobacterium endosymbiont of Lamellibrachia anaximandri]|nr:hypothetical protein [gamma proteobacterium endosymbiont of Lamellibrachia anaximandri]MBL3535806.1 hypothetical protein [gamma proteobacterium endosymbiont of Lamellibrachia anaximandri]
MKNLSIFCADVGSIKAKNFGWAATLSNGQEETGDDITIFSKRIAEEIKKGSKVAIGFECPLFVPMRNDHFKVNSARAGEGNRSWSAGAGTGALATGLVEVLWVMNSLNKLLSVTPKSEFNWDKFKNNNSIFLWEAFVTSKAKGTGHSEDALIAVKIFKKALPDLWSKNAIQEEHVLSLVGAAALRAGWSENIGVLSEQCLVLKA